MADVFDDFIDRAIGDGSQQPDDVARLDASIAETIRHLHFLHEAPVPGAARERARQRVFDSVDTDQENTMSALPLTIPLSNGVASPQIRPSLLIPLPARPAVQRPRWALLSMAAALLILLAGIGSYLAWDTFSGNDSAPAVIPAAQETATPGIDWPMYRGDAARTGVVPGSALSANPGEIWQVTLDGSAYRSPVVIGDTAFVGTASGTLYALDAATGEEQWTFTGDGSMEMTPAYRNGVVYAPSLLGTLYAIDATTGNELWRFAKPLAEYATPTFSDDLLIAGSESAREIYGIDPVTGEEVWSFQADGGIHRTQSYADGVIISGSLGGIVYALDASDGTELWRYDAQSESVGTVAVSGGKAFTAGADGSLIVIDVASGKEIARIDTLSPDGITPPAVSDGVAYVGGSNATVVALDIDAGTVIWTAEMTSAMRVGPVLVDGVLNAVGVDNVLYALDSTDGSELWTYQLDGGVNSGPSVANGMIYVSTDTGTVVAIGNNPEGGNPTTVATPESDGTPVAETTGIDQSGIELLWDSTEIDSLGVPGGLDVAPDGNIYVTDVQANAIHVFAPDGTLLETWGEAGTGPGQFHGPEDIGIDADGNIFVFDIGNSRIQKFSPDHSFLLEWGTSGTGNGEFTELHGFVDREHGLVYVVEFLGSRVQVFDLDGNFLDKWGSAGPGNGQFRQPATVVSDAAGNVYVGETNNGSNSRVQKFDSVGTWQATLGGSSEEFPASFSEVWGIAFDANGNLYVADYWANSIQVFGPDFEQIGVITDIPGAGPLNHPLRMRFDADGFLYLVDWDNQRVLKVSVPLPG